MKRPITFQGFVFTGFVVCLIILGVWLRTWQLGAVPIAINYDDLDYVANGWSFAKTGQDLLSQTKWWQPKPLQTGAFTSELGPHWHMLTGLFDWQDPVLGARLSNVIFGFLSVGLLGYLSWILFHKKALAVITAIFFLVTPWAVMISRSPIDATVGIFWQLLGLVSVIQVVKQSFSKKMVAWSIVSLASYVMAFYSYHAYKFSVLFSIWWIFLYWVWNYLTVSNIKKSTLLIIACIVLVSSTIGVVFFLSAQKGAVGGRQQELIFFNQDLLSSQVNTDRRDAIDHTLASAFINKPLVITEHWIEQFFKAVNPEYLFLHSGDSSVANSFYDFGYLYVVFLPLIVIGTFWTWNVKRTEFWFLMGLTFVSLMPVLIQTNFSAVLRAGMYFLFLTLFASIGFFVLFSSKSNLFRCISFGAGIILLIQVVWFGHWYFWVYPIKLADSQTVADRVLAGYLSKLPDDSDSAIVIAENPRSWYRTFAFYTGLFDRNKIHEITATMSEKSLSDEMRSQLILMTESCSSTQSAQGAVVISPELLEKCGRPFAKTIENQLISVLSSPSDNRAYFYVFNDQVCDKFSGVPFVNIKNHSQLQPEKMSREEFCQTWVRKEVK